MSQQIELISPQLGHPGLPEVAKRAAMLAAQSKGQGTRAVYASVWGVFSDWCATYGFDPFRIDPATMAQYIAHRSTSLSASYLYVNIAAIKEAFHLSSVKFDWDDPFLVRTVQGAMREKAGVSKRKARAITPGILRRLVEACANPETHIGARDRAMLLLAFGAAGRQSEVVGLLIGDVTIEPGLGLRVLVRRSKTDQLGDGATIGVLRNPRDPEMCPLAACQRWMRHRKWAYSGPDTPLFTQIDKSGRVTANALSSKGFYRAITGAAAAAGLADTGISGHSPRRGWATTAARRGASLQTLMQHMRHEDPAISAGYIADAKLFEDAIDPW